MKLPVIDMRKTGRNIAMLRERRGISVRQLQIMLGFATPQAIYKWQHGLSLPTVDNLVALSAIFAVPIDALMVQPAALRWPPPLNFAARTVASHSPRVRIEQRVSRVRSGIW